MNASWRWGGLVVVAVLLAGFFALDLGQYLTLAKIKAHQAQLQALYAQSPWTVLWGLGAVYVVVTALSLPGAVVLSLAAGGLLGLTVGTVLVSIASTLGATAAMLSARYVLRDWVMQRWGSRLESLQRGIDRDGAFYLFTLRLLPVVPFVLVNLAMGLTRMKTFTYFWVSQVGMLAATLAYVNAGTQLARIDSPADILSPALWGSFALLAVLPLVARQALARWKTRQVYARWAGQRPAHFDRNLIVIGGGAAGLVSAYIAAAVKAQVTLVEAHHMGGDCLNLGCVPSKTLIQSAQRIHQARQGAPYGLRASDIAVDFQAVMQRVRSVIDDIAPHDSVARYTALGVQVRPGYARLVDPWTVEITGHDGSLERLTARSIVIAAGARPIVPALPGLEAVGCLTSDTLWDAMAQRTQAPARLLVLGGGPVGCELAQAFARLGSDVTLVEQGPWLLPQEDTDASALVRQSLEADGVRVLTGHEALRAQQVDGHKHLVLRQGAQEISIVFDDLICAVGRAARLSGYGLEALGIPTHRTIDTNDYLQTLYPHIYAAGDVAGPYQLTHVAAHQAWYATVNALFAPFKTFQVDYRVIPRTTFVDPPVASVGLHEQQAQAQGIAYELTRYDLGELDRAITDGQTRGFVKVLTAPGRDRILGVTLVGQHAGELLAEYVLAMKHGLGLNKILATVHAYPTWTEANQRAAGQWRRTHAPRWVLVWLQRFHSWRRG